MSTPKTISYSAAFKYGLITYIDNFMLFLKIFLCCALAYVVLFSALLFTGIAGWHMHWINFSPMPLWGGTYYMFEALPSITAALLLIKLLIFLLFEYFFYQMLKIGMKLYDNGSADWKEFFVLDTNLFFDFIVARMWYSLKIVLGLLLILLPGIYFGTTYYFTGFPLIDKKAHSVKEDALIAYSLASNFWNLFWFALLIMILSGFANNMFGLLFAPALILARVHAYKQLTSDTYKEPGSLANLGRQPEASF